MPTHVYTPAEMAPLADVSDIHKRALTYGYTGVSVAYKEDADGEFYSVTLNEAFTKATVRSNLLITNVPLLTASTTDLQVAGDGLATGNIVISDSRGTGAEGDVVNVTLSQTMAVSSVTLTLNSIGQALLVFGPSPSAGIKSPKMLVTFHYADGKAAPLTATCQYT